ncbi:hypothetical protein BDP27DRAFT_1366207 [Rhodocollybia butyracea]|uniref:Uncharacterized protein n=1 Tax=Rhodocollybia butyracea TaxID=206335 RepID=A0A9P5PLT3_9AGAR|nr:hypothetical protein BDP27DRAFT_1366207 [Rhodocollybia butyracea]
MCLNASSNTGALFLVLFLQVTAVRLQAVNRSIDDTFGDSVTGQRPVFSPTTPGVWANQSCTRCAIQPPTSDAFDGTYTASTYNSTLGNISITFDFIGTAVYIFFILVNNPPNPNIAATTAANFTLDGALVGNFTHAPDPLLPDFQFNESALAFSTSDLENATHQMVISTSGLNESIFVNFDYALYTFENAVETESLTSESQSPTFVTSTGSSPRSTTKNRSPVGAIVGGVIGGLAALGASVAVLFFRWRQSRPSALTSATLLYLNRSEVSNPPPVDTISEPRHPWQRVDLNEEIEQLRGKAGEPLYLLHSPSCANFVQEEVFARGTNTAQLQGQIHIMSEQIALLQARQSSMWEQGLSNEAPPPYTSQLPS